MKTKTNKIVTLLASAAVLICGNAKGQLYSDAFTTDTSAAWTIRAASVTAVDDYTAQFAFYYATNKFVRGGVTNTIPLAPNSTIGVATNGLKLTVNKNDATPDASGINLYPNLGSTFSNDFALKFDMWVNYNGGEFGGSGSTEFAIWGVNMDGLHTNWAAGGSVEQGDGVWYGVTGEGGAARDGVRTSAMLCSLAFRWSFKLALVDSSIATLTRCPSKKCSASQTTLLFV